MGEATAKISVQGHRLVGDRVEGGFRLYAENEHGSLIEEAFLPACHPHTIEYERD